MSSWTLLTLDYNITRDVAWVNASFSVSCCFCAQGQLKDKDKKRHRLQELRLDMLDVILNDCVTMVRSIC